MTTIEGDGRDMRPKHIPMDILQRKIEAQISRDIITAGMPPQYVDLWRGGYALLVAGAIDSKRLALSPRGFLVGGSVCYWDKKSNQDHVTSDTNFKHSNNQPPPKMCAERRLLRQLHLNSLISQKNKERTSLADIVEPEFDVIGLVEVSDKANPTQPGEKQPEDYKEERLVLHPCAECLSLLSHDNLIKPWTRIVMVNDSDRDHLIIEDKSVEELLKQHGAEKSPSSDYVKYIGELFPDLRLF